MQDYINEFEKMLEESLKPVQVGDCVRGEILSIENKGIVVDIGAKYLGFIPSALILENENSNCNYTVGSVIDSIIVYQISDSQGLYMLGFNTMNTIVRQYHATQRRNSNPEIPYTEHLFGVASILESVAGTYNEINGSILRDMKNAALGHDLLEDTLANERTILQATNDKALRLIKELTNPNDDVHTDEYMEQIENASEEARLIKYADLIENTSSFCYSLHEPHIEVPITRAKEFYLPILRRTTDVLAATSFELYPKTSEAMKTILKVYTDLLLSRIALLEPEFP